MKRIGGWIRGNTHKALEIGQAQLSGLVTIRQRFYYMPENNQGPLCESSVAINPEDLPAVIEELIAARENYEQGSRQ